MVNWRRNWNLLLLAALMLGLLPLTAMAQPAASPDWSKVDPLVLGQLEVKGTAGFYVILSIQGDVTGAAALSTKVEKTTYVYNVLSQVARETQGPLLEYLRALGVPFESRYIQNMIQVEAGLDVVEWMASRGDVAQIVSLPDPQLDPVYRDKTPVEREAIEWNIIRVHAPEVWAMGVHGEGMVVASNDTGVDYTHPALVTHYRGNLGGGNFDHNYNWWNGPGSTSPSDNNGHGTHTTGTMVGDDGGANQIGVAPGAQWIACGGLYNSEPLECFEFFLAPWDLTGQNPDPTKAPDAINNSWYDPSGFDYRPIIQALNAAGVAVIKSAGNNGPGCGTISNPGYVPEIIATAAFAQGDTIASFSSRGPTSNYGETILKPEVAAPGVNVRSSVPGGGYEGGWSGTSMAAPHTTALVALMWSAAPCLQGDVPTTKQIMMETAEGIVDAQCPPFVDVPNDVWGWGVLDDYTAVQMATAFCGGLGTLEGTVTDIATNDPLEGVEIRAEAGGGYYRTATTDAAGFYTMDVPADTYTVSASTYGYEPGEVTGVVVEADQTTVQDFALTALPVWTVDGLVLDAVTMEPLFAEVSFVDAPVTPVFTDPATGYYSIEVAEGTWNLRAEAALHLPQTQELMVYSNVTQDFYLEPLPCILLVDDDQDGPDVRSYYTEALDALGLDYSVWDVSGQGDPTANDLAGYAMVFWFTGYPYSQTFTSGNEAAVGAYLDAGGKFFMSSQDYLWDYGLTPFGQNYLHIASFSSDVSQTTVTGQNVFAGLGPYALSYPFTNYSDIVQPDAQAQVAFVGNQGNAAISYDEGSFQTVFFGFPFEAIPGLQDRADVLGTIVDWFGGCAPPDDTMHVEGIAGFFSTDYMGRPVLRMHVLVEDAAGVPLSNVAVDASIWAPDGGPYERTRYTKPGGNARFHWGSKASGTWTLCVDWLTLAGYSYNPGDNEVTCQDWYY